MRSIYQAKTLPAGLGSLLHGLKRSPGNRGPGELWIYSAEKVWAWDKYLKHVLLSQGQVLVENDEEQNHDQEGGELPTEEAQEPWL